MEEFDPENKFSWYFGKLSRSSTDSILEKQEQYGTYLVRESTSKLGDFVLCVKEDNKINHYIINRIKVSPDSSRFKIGDKEFSDIPSLLNFYKTHFLNTATLVKPVQRKRLLCKFDFAGRDPEDLPFRKGDFLEVIYEDEEKWWTAINLSCQTGQVPVSYTEVVQNMAPARPPSIDDEEFPRNRVTLPAKAVAILRRVPCAYDETQLRLEVGDIVTVLKMNPNGQWEGRDKRNKEGIFPFTHIRFLSEEELCNLQSSA